jgi:hypothetical protein
MVELVLPAVAMAADVRRSRFAYFATQSSNCGSVSGNEPLGPARFGIKGDMSIQPADATSFHTTMWWRFSYRCDSIKM